MYKLLFFGDQIYIDGIGWVEFEKGYCHLRIDESYYLVKFNENDYSLQDRNNPEFEVKLKVRLKV